MEVLVLGAGGMAGHMTAIYLAERGHQVTGFARRELSFCNTIVGDALNQADVHAAVRSKPFDAVVNCIGVLNRDVDLRPAEGIYLNSYFPHDLVDCLRDTDTRIIHLSTDCVYSGAHGRYSENSFRDANDLYGRSKALGEIWDDRNLTIRTSIVGPDLREQGTGLLNWFLRQQGSIHGYTAAIWTGVSTFTLAQAIEIALQERVSGLYHLVNKEAISKYYLLQLFNRLIRKEPIEIIPDDHYKVDKSLLNNRSDWSFVVPTYEQMIRDTKSWIDAHSDLYPHYK